METVRMEENLKIRRGTYAKAQTELKQVPYAFVIGCLSVPSSLSVLYSLSLLPHYSCNSLSVSQQPMPKFLTIWKSKH